MVCPSLQCSVRRCNVSAALSSTVLHCNATHPLPLQRNRMQPGPVATFSSATIATQVGLPLQHTRPPLQHNPTLSHCNAVHPTGKYCNPSAVATLSRPLQRNPAPFRCNGLSVATISLCHLSVSRSVSHCNGLSIATLSRLLQRNPAPFRCNDLTLPSIRQPLQHSHPLRCNAALSSCNALINISHYNAMQLCPPRRPPSPPVWDDDDDDRYTLATTHLC